MVVWGNIMSDKVSTSVTLTTENREYLDREVNNRSAFINDLIEAHRNGKSDMEEAIARHRREQLLSELNRVESREEQIKDELEHIQMRISEEQERKAEQLEKAKDALAEVPKEPDNPAIENWADKLDMTPRELLDTLEDGND